MKKQKMLLLICCICTTIAFAQTTPKVGCDSFASKELAFNFSKITAENYGYKFLKDTIIQRMRLFDFETEKDELQFWFSEIKQDEKDVLILDKIVGVYTTANKIYTEVVGRVYNAEQVKKNGYEFWKVFCNNSSKQIVFDTYSKDYWAIKF